MKDFLVIEHHSDGTYVCVESEDHHMTLENIKCRSGGRSGFVKKSLKDMEKNCELGIDEYVVVELGRSNEDIVIENDTSDREIIIKINDTKEIDMKKVVSDTLGLVVTICDINEKDRKKCYAYKDSNGRIVSLMRRGEMYRWAFLYCELEHGTEKVWGTLISYNTIHDSVEYALSIGHEVIQFRDWRELFKWTLLQTS